MKQINIFYFIAIIRFFFIFYIFLMYFQNGTSYFIIYSTVLNLFRTEEIVKYVLT